MNLTAQHFIEKYQMQKHPEGGCFKETYRSPIAQNFNGFSGERNLATSILFLLKAGERSTWHYIKSDEIWYYQFGETLGVHCIFPDGTYQLLKLGLDEDAQLQHIVPAGTLFGSAVINKTGFSMVACMVAPGFDFQDFEMPSFESLLVKFPKLEKELNLLK